MISPVGYSSSRGAQAPLVPLVPAPLYTVSSAYLLLELTINIHTLIYDKVLYKALITFMKSVLQHTLLQTRLYTV